MSESPQTLGAVVPVRDPLPLAERKPKPRLLRLTLGATIAKARGGTARTLLAFGCVAVGILTLFGPSPIYRSEATLLVSGEGIGGGASLEGARIVVSYLRSQDAARDLGGRLALAALLEPVGLAPLTDWIGATSNASPQTLGDRLQKRLDIDLDETSGHVQITFDAHRPQDAHDAIEGLLDGAEMLVNRMGSAARSRRIEAASQRLRQAEEDVRRILAERATLQENTSLLDPRLQAEREVADLDRLRSEGMILAVERARLAALAPNSPRLVALDERQRALEDAALRQGDATRREAGTAAILAADDSLTLSRTLAVAGLEASNRRLEAALDAERAERIYVSTIAAPSLADRPVLRPRAWQLAIAALLTVSAILLLRRRADT